MIEADKYTIKEFAEMAGVSRQWLYILWAEGKGPEKSSDKSARATA